jgi:hypothetical protein
MVFISLPKTIHWGNLYLQLSGVLGPSPCYGGGLRAPLLFGPQTCTSPCFQRLVYRDVLVHPRFLMRPRLLTRFSDLPPGEGYPLSILMPKYL